jgi:hypothetical protein
VKKQRRERSSGHAARMKENKIELKILPEKLQGEALLKTP